MSEEYWKQKYEDLKYYYDQRGYKIDDLQKQNNDLYLKLDSAEFRIHNELEPRIKSEQRSYDVYVTSGGSDECFQNGDSGRCGIECSIFGEREYCLDNFTGEKLLEAYEYGHNMQILLDLIEEEGLSERRKDIDRKNIMNQIVELEEKLLCLRSEYENIK